MAALYRTIMVSTCVIFVSYWFYCIFSGKMVGK